MDINIILQAVSTVGFPIVMCGLLFWYMIKQNETHSEESKEMREAIASLKEAIIQLIEKLKGD